MFIKYHRCLQFIKHRPQNYSILIMTLLLVFSFIGNIHSYLSISIVVIVAGALTTVLSRASETNRSNVDQQPRGSLQGQVDEEEVPPLPPPLRMETRRRYITYMIRYRCEYKLSYLHGMP